MSNGTQARGGTSNAMRESLSALMDGEASEIELHRILARVEDPEVRTTWSAMHCNSDALRSGEIIGKVDISAAVNHAIADIHAPVAPEKSVSAGVRRSLASFAVAASVTAVVVLGGQQLLSPSDSPLPATASGSPGPVGVSGAMPVRASFGSRPEKPALMQQPASGSSYQELARQRLRQYSQAHAEQAALNTPQGLVPFARIRDIQPE